MTPDPLTRLITDLSLLVATMLPAIDLAQQFAGGDGRSTRNRLQLVDKERADVPSCPAPPAS